MIAKLLKNNRSGSFHLFRISYEAVFVLAKPESESLARGGQSIKMQIPGPWPRPITLAPRRVELWDLHL